MSGPRGQLFDALEDCKRAVWSYPEWLKAVERLRRVRAQLSKPTIATRAVDAYLKQAEGKTK